MPFPGSTVTWLFHAIQMNGAAGRKELKEPENIGDFPEGSEKTYPAKSLASKYLKNTEGI